MRLQGRYAAAALAAAVPAAAGVWRLASPDGTVVVEVGLSTALAWRVAYRGTEVLRPAPLGLVRDDQDFSTGLEFTGERGRRIVEDYEMPAGRRRRCRNVFQEMVLSFTNARGARLEVVARAAADGVALRYRFPDVDPVPRRVLREETSFRLPADAVAWIQPYDRITKWTPAYERFYEHGVPVGALATNAAGWCFPALFRVRPDGPWVLLTESDLDDRYCACRLRSGAEPGLVGVRFPDPDEGMKTGAVEPFSPLPWQTPWRVVMLGATPSAFVESTLAQDLGRPAVAGRPPRWVRPGRVAWSWWAEQDSPRRPDRMKQWIDFAAEMGWEYFLVDANWNYVEEKAILDLLRHARRRNVGILLWYNSGGPHNEVTEAPPRPHDARPVRRREMAWLKGLGVAGLKVDFFQSDKQNVVAHYLDILRDAADHRLMINFHGCTIPRGWQRTWPHLMTMEAVRGAECYIFDLHYPAAAPALNTILPFTRNASARWTTHRSPFPPTARDG